MSLCQKAGVSSAHSFEEWGLSHQKFLKPSRVIPNLHYNPCLILRSGSDASPCGTALRMLVATWNFFRSGHQHPVLEHGHLDIVLIVVPIVTKLCKYWRTVCPVTAMHMRIVLSSAERWRKALCRTVGVLNNGAKIMGCGKHYGMEKMVCWPVDPRNPWTKNYENVPEDTGLDSSMVRTGIFTHGAPHFTLMQT